MRYGISRITLNTSQHATHRLNMLFELQAATLQARAKTGDKNIGTQVAKGLVDVVRAVPPASGCGAYSVTVLRAGLTPAQAVAHLAAMQ